MNSSREELKSHFSEKLGDHLRSIFEYTSTGGDFIYLRDDIHEEYAEQTLAELAGISYEVHEAVAPLRFDPPATKLGDYEATIHVFEEAYAVQCAQNRHSGFALSFDKDADIDPDSVLEDVKQLYDRVS